MANEPRSSNQVYFEPDEHPEDTLKSFDEFIKVFGLRYDAQYPDPPSFIGICYSEMQNLIRHQQ